MLKSKNGWYPNQGQPLKAEYVEVQYENGDTDIALASDFVWDKSYSDEYYRITEWRHVNHEPKKVILAENGGKVKSDGSTASYYELPENAKELQNLISHRNMNAQIGEIFRACYRYGLVEHSECLRDAKKILFYAKAEVERLEAL